MKYCNNQNGSACGYQVNGYCNFNGFCVYVSNTANYTPIQQIIDTKKIEGLLEKILKLLEAK